MLKNFHEGLGGKSSTREVFELDYCAHIYHAERWCTRARKEFGKHARSVQFLRHEKWLKSNRARLLVVACARKEVKLEGEQQTHVTYDTVFESQSER